MHPKQPKAEPQEDLFRARLENLVDPRHALVRLAGLIDWGRFGAEFGPLYTDGGRPGLPTGCVYECWPTGAGEFWPTYRF